MQILFKNLDAKLEWARHANITILWRTALRFGEGVSQISSRDFNVITIDDIYKNNTKVIESEHI